VWEGIFPKDKWFLLVLLEEQPPTNSYLFLYVPAPHFYTNTIRFGWVWPFHSSVEESLTAPILLAPQHRKDLKKKKFFIFS